MTGYKMAAMKTMDTLIKCFIEHGVHNISDLTNTVWVYISSPRS